METNQSPAEGHQRKIYVLLLLVCLAVTGTAVAAGFVSSTQGSKRVSLSVQDPRPVAKAIERLEAKYGWVITYEDPLYIYDREIADVSESVRKDLSKFQPGKAPRVLIPKGGALTIQYDVTSDTNLPSDSAMVVQEVLNTHFANGNAGMFRLEKSGEIMHVIPTASRNATGYLVSQASVLDAIISIPEEERTGYQTLEAVCAAVGQASQTNVGLGTVPLNLFIGHQDRTRVVNQKARDVLTDLLERTQRGTKLSWQLFYDPTMKSYFLNIHPIRRE